MHFLTSLEKRSLYPKEKHVFSQVLRAARAMWVLMQVLSAPWSGASSGLFISGLIRALIRVLVKVFLRLGLNVSIQTKKLWCRYQKRFIYVVSIVFSARCVRDLSATLG